MTFSRAPVPWMLIPLTLTACSGSRSTSSDSLGRDETRDKTYAWRPSDRNLVELDLTSGAATALGETHTAVAYDAAPSRGFTVATVDCQN